MKKALIVANGYVDKKYIEEIHATYDCVVACDGGYNHIYDLRVDVLIGDLDSVDKTLIKKDVKLVQYSPIKDNTDLELSIDYLLTRGYTIDISGFYGSRIDHSLANILLFKKYKSSIRFIDRLNILEYKDANFLIEKRDAFFSLIPITKVVNLSITGAKYELSHKDIEVGESLLNSNEFLDTDVKVSFDSGEMILIYSKDK